MTVALAMIAKDEADHIGAALESVRPWIDSWTILDNGSCDKTPDIAREVLGDLSGQVVRDPEQPGVAALRERVLDLAKGTADWLLMMDADMTVEAHPEFRDWLDRWPSPTGDPDPAVTAWQLEIEDKGLVWRMPWLMRGDLSWQYRGETHACLVTQGKQRPVRGIRLLHHGPYDPAKPERDIEALAAGVAAGDPRSIYYTAWALKALGRTDEAATMYARRAAMKGTWEEERWHAAYWAARLRRDVNGLLAVYRERPWRHEPLSHAARFVAEDGARDDLLFLEKRHG